MTESDTERERERERERCGSVFRGTERIGRSDWEITGVLILQIRARFQSDSVRDRV